MSKFIKPAHDLKKKWRSDDVRLKEDANFMSLLLPEEVLKGLENSGYQVPSPIQIHAIPVGRMGRDLIVQAKSGTGKTLVFTIIALDILMKVRQPQVIIISPTREIALQICDVVRAVGSEIENLSCQCFIGGINIENDAEAIKDCQIVVGTPGRLNHLLKLGILAVNSIRLLVLDEFDVLLQRKFKEDVDRIFLSLSQDKQVIATSASYPKEMECFTEQYFRNPHFVRLNSHDNYDELYLLGMVHYIYPLELPKMCVLEYQCKLRALEKVLGSVDFTQCLVFCNMISRVQSLSNDIAAWGFPSTFICSIQDQRDRIKAINALKRFRVRVLVSSDVTSRGIDAENVDLIINFDRPKETTTYFHRCGRAGRYGSKGAAVTFMSTRDKLFTETIKNTEFQLYFLPDPIPLNLIKLRPQECATRAEHQPPGIEGKKNLAEISSVKDVDSHEEHFSENKEVVKMLSSNSNDEADRESSLAASKKSNMVLHDEVKFSSDSEVLFDENPKNRDRATRAEHQPPGIEGKKNLAEISSVKDVDSHEEHFSENKEVVKMLSSNSNDEADGESSLAASKKSNLVLHDGVKFSSDSEVLFDENPNNSDRKILASNVLSQAGLGDQFSNASCQKSIADHLDFVEIDAISLSEEGFNKNVSHEKNNQNLNDIPREKKEDKENSSLNSMEKIEAVSVGNNIANCSNSMDGSSNSMDSSISFELNAALNIFPVEEKSSLNKTKSKSKKSLDPFVKRYMSMRKDVEEFYKKVYSEYEYEAKDEERSMSNDVKNNLEKFRNADINEFLWRPKPRISRRAMPIKKSNVVKDSIENTNISLKPDIADAITYAESGQNISSNGNTLHSSTKSLSFSLSKNYENANEEISFENYRDSGNKSVKKHAEYQAKDKKYSEPTSSDSSSSSESLMSIAGQNTIYLSKSKAKERKVYSTKQNKIRNVGYLENDCSKKETHAKEKKDLGARRKIFTSIGRSKIQKSHSCRRQTEMIDEENSLQERSSFNKHLNKTKSCNKIKTKSFENVSDQYQYDQDTDDTSVCAHANGKYYDRGYKRGNAANLRSNDQNNPPYSSCNFLKESPYFSHSHPFISPVCSCKCKNHKACDYRNHANNSCYYELCQPANCQHNFILQQHQEYLKKWKFIKAYAFKNQACNSHCYELCICQHNFSSHWLEEYYKQWAFIQGTIDSNN